MKLKTALELLGEQAGTELTMTAQLELVARRAREEAFEIAAVLMDRGGAHNAAEAIRALPTEPETNCPECRMPAGAHKRDCGRGR